MQKMQIKFLGQEDPWKETATNSSIFSRSLVGYKRAGHYLVSKQQQQNYLSGKYQFHYQKSSNDHNH